MTDETSGGAAARLLAQATTLATARGDDAIAGEHLLAALFQDVAPARAALGAVGLDADAVSAQLLAQARPPKPKAATPTSTAAAAAAETATVVEPTAPAAPLPTSQARRLLALAERFLPEGAGTLGERELLLAAAQEPRGPFARVLNAAKVSPFALRQAAVRVVDGDAAADALVDPATRRKPRDADEAPVTDAAVPMAAPEQAEPVVEDAAAAAAREARRAERQAARAAAKDARKARAAERAATQPAQPEAPARSQASAKADKREQQAAEKRPDVRTRERTERRTELVDVAPTSPKAPSIGRIAPQKPGPLWRKVLLAAVPASIALSLSGTATPLALFLVACLAVLPLASLMGEATEHLAARTNPTLGGLLNASFGNAAELIIAGVALQAGYVELVKASITGSILGNLLLILGLSIIAGGLERPRIRFNRTGAGMSAGMLALAVVGLVFPAILHAVRPDAASRLADELHLSEAVAVILLATYALSLLFTLKTHQRLLGSDPHPTEGPVWPVGKAVAVLAVATGFVAWESEILVHAVEGVTATMGIPEAFLGLIIVPFIGNAAEHAAAIVVARKGKIDLAFQIALGSSTQIALLVAPALVFFGLLVGQRMDLVFTPFEVAALGLSVLVASIVTLDGESHWFEGVQLLAVYLMVGAAAFFL